MENVVYEPQTSLGTGPPGGRRSKAAGRASSTAADPGRVGPLAPAAWRVLRAGLLSCALLAFSVLAAPVASAAIAHTYSTQFGAPGQGNGEFSGPGGVAVDQSSGDVIVVDRTNLRVQRFNGVGDYQTQWNGSGTPALAFGGPAQVATNATGSSVYVADQYNFSAPGLKGAVNRFSAAGAYQDQLSSANIDGMFTMPTGVAVDPTNGDVYVSISGMGVVERFDSTGAYLSEFGSGELSNPGHLAVDGNHGVYVVDAGNGRVVKYVGGTLASTVDTNAPTAVAADPVSDDIYVVQGGTQVARYASDGDLQETFGAGRITSAGGMAVNGATGRVYVSDSSANVILTFRQITVPTVTTTPGATGVDANNASVAGTVNPEGGTTSVRFEYGTSSSYGSATPDVDVGAGTTGVPASADITGLTPGTTYHFRVVATGPNGTGRGSDQTFTTEPAGAAVDGQPAYASAIGTDGATLNGTLNANGASTTYHFEYGTSTAYGSSSPAGDGGSAAGDVPVSTGVTGLTPGTTYHFRLVADNSAGPDAVGADQTFTTAPATAPTATDITALTATLRGTVNAQGVAATYRFEYGTDTSYGSSTAETDAGFATTDLAVAKGVSGLTPGTTYHFRVVATLNGQTVSSDDATFTTIATPTVQTDAVTGVTATAATFNATVDAHGTAGTFSIAVQSQDSTYRRAATGTLAAIDGPQSVSAALSDLPPGEEFTVRASATVGGAIRFGEQLTFTTPPGPPIENPPPTPPSEPYGCATPRIDAISVRPKVGDTVTVTGSDLGVGGKITLGSGPVKAQAWTATGVTFVVPDGASGTQPLAVNCGRASNAVNLTIAQPGDRSDADDAFSITKTSVTGSTATVSVKVTGPGKIQTSGRNAKTRTTTISKAGTVKVKVQLSGAGKKALAKAKSGKLKTSVRVTFTPTGGKGVTKTKLVTFVRKAAR